VSISPRRTVPFVIALFSFAPVLSSASRPALPLSAPSAADKFPAFLSTYGQAPLYFEPNLGQFDPRVRYASRGGGYSLFLTDADAVLVLERAHRQWAVRMKLEGGRVPAQWEAEEKQPGLSNYFLGNDPAKWRTNVPNYARVRARDIYPGIDLICYGNQRQLEYDLVVEPGADPSRVQLAWEGADSLRLNEAGDLVLATPLGEIVQKRPRVYQQLGGRQVEVASHYVLSRHNRVRFELARYDRHRPLRIDPLVLAYSTFLGGGSDDYGYSIAVDAAGSAYVTGYTASTNFPTFAAGQSSKEGTFNVFVTKLSPSGSSLAYSTYLGGSLMDQGWGIAVDATGAAYVAGQTTSADFPTLSAFQSALAGSTNAFVAKLSPSGSSLVYSTYLGGSGADIGYGIAIDSTGAAYVTGQTSSTNFPTHGAYQSSLAGAQDAFVTKLAPTGDSLVYSTYLGGSGQDTAYCIAIDASGAAYAAGTTASSNFPTASAYQTTLKGLQNVFVTKLTPAGNALAYSTYIGGHSVDAAYGIAVDGLGAAYVAGSTTSANYPTETPFQSTINGVQNVFVTKLAVAGNTLVYSTYLGGRNSDQAHGIAVDGQGQVYLAGWASSPDFPLESPFQSAMHGGSSVFVTKLTAAGTALSYSTFLDGGGIDYGHGIAVDASGAAYVTGYTASTDFPTQTPYQAIFAGPATDVFVTKIPGSASGTPPGLFAPLSPANGATGLTLSPTLTWGNSSGAASYEVHLGTSSSPPVVTSTANSNYAPATLAPSTTYYWYVVAQNSSGSTSSSTWSFTTAAAVSPAAPALISPYNQATGVTVAPTLSWNAASGATSYDVYFGASATPPFVANTTGTTYAPGALNPQTVYYWQIVARNGSATAASVTWSFTTSAPETGLYFVPVTPCRVMDTRGAAGQFGGPTMAGNTARSFIVPQSNCGIPATALAYSLNVTVVPSGGLAYLTLWPAGQTQPLVSTLNSFGGIVVANAAIVPAGTGGAVSVFVTNQTDVILDIDGYFASSAGPTSFAFYPATPCRVADTRGATGTFGGPALAGGQERDFPITVSPCGIPAASTAFSMNVTVVPQGPLYYLTLWPTGLAQPGVSTLNSWTGKVVANAAIVPAGNNGSVSVYVTNQTDAIMDINGYFGQSGTENARLFYPVTPCRIADTRGAVGPFGGPEMEASTARTFAIPASACNIPSTAVAYSLNVTVVPDSVLSYLTAWPAGAAQPFVSTLNSFDGSVVANAAIVPAGTGGAISIFVTDRTHVILDVNGYFAP